ncbi:hypothetical protein CY652_11805 [Burkholderia sp. WAC0059]|uniref:hypothetical protein n=1 Tax=Burkholderia sp. WAC0059 TaxID=2066022 RepID=UPI000C7F569E|nr:hypothetical protein [Burkholderia sp. WAC0059]PLZ02063.1 hypothetical protein CY652_11805 [Burkholderia sp. WAC0059]
MKPLLRVVLVIDALLMLACGGLLLLTPWKAFYSALELVPPQPALIGQAFGVVLLGFAWLALRGAIDGALTSAVGRVAGHVYVLCGVLVLVWMIGLHEPRVSGLGQLAGGLGGVLLVVFGLAGSRLSGAVRRRERAEASEAAAARRAAKTAEPPRQRREPVDGNTPRVSPSWATPAASGEPAPESVQQAPASTTDSARPAGSEASPDEDSAAKAARDEAAGVSSRPPFHG